jgi:general secretion pathway protein C
VTLLRARRMLGPFVENAPLIAVLALLLIAGWLAARWFLYFLAPVEMPPGHPREQVQFGPAAQALADAHLFGVAPTGAGGQVVSNLNIKLKGVFAGGASGAAIVNTGGKDEAARVGSEIVPGVILESVHPQYMLLRRNGALERVDIEERQQVAGAVSPVLQRRAGVRGAGAAPNFAQAVPPTPPSPGSSFERPQPYAPVGDVQTEPPPAPAPAPPPAAVAAPQPPPAPPGAATGLAITSVPPGSMLEQLGLQPGDVIRSVNGEAVMNEADMARIVQSSGLQGPFTVEVQRGGATIPVAVGQRR